MAPKKLRFSFALLRILALQQVKTLLFVIDIVFALFVSTCQAKSLIVSHGAAEFTEFLSVVFLCVPVPP